MNLGREAWIGTELFFRVRIKKRRQQAHVVENRGCPGRHQSVTRRAPRVRRVLDDGNAPRGNMGR